MLDSPERVVPDRVEHICCQNDDDDVNNDGDDVKKNGDDDDNDDNANQDHLDMLDSPERVVPDRVEQIGHTLEFLPEDNTVIRSKFSD